MAQSSWQDAKQRVHTVIWQSENIKSEFNCYNGVGVSLQVYDICSKSPCWFIKINCWHPPLLLFNEESLGGENITEFLLVLFNKFGKHMALRPSFMSNSLIFLGLAFGLPSSPQSNQITLWQNRGCLDIQYVYVWVKFMTFSLTRVTNHIPIHQ